MSSKYAIVVARFNSSITAKLYAGTLAALHEAKIPESSIEVVNVPGAFELPLAAKALASTREFAAVICLGAVIRGDTDHYDYVCRAATDGILQAGMETGVPIIFGVLTCADEEQALARAGGTEGNKGAAAALAAIEMAEKMGRIRLRISPGADKHTT